MHFLDTPNTTAASLRHTDQKRLLELLNKLGSPDVAKRAEAALAASQLVLDKGLTWSSLLPAVKPGQASASADWRGEAARLLAHPDITPADAALLRRVLEWSSPGKSGLATLRAVADRTGASNV